MDPNEGVVATVVGDETEADLACGMLQAAGIDCAQRPTEAIDSTLEDFTTSAGAREIVVRRAADRPRAAGPQRGDAHARAGAIHHDRRGRGPRIEEHPRPAGAGGEAVAAGGQERQADLPG